MARLVTFCFLLCLSVRGELVLTNFTAANPIKVMAIGDSITDDCVTNGAWRLFLQPQLETNGYPFTFIGRQVSGTVPSGFTKTKHEGYCGAVIGAPGVVGSTVHGYIGTDVYLQKIVRDALTNTSPDVILILIGANDIGRGRNPYYVVTNSVVNLLNLINTYASNASVVLPKITMLQDGPYTAYATNAPISNARLQALVNQRRAAGKNVFLADMFSVVDYSTMFLSDHLHPNPLGLKAMAAEWVARIETFVSWTNRFSSVLINGGANWKYSDFGQDLGTHWSQLNFDDSGWSEGPARLGYGDLATATTVSHGSDTTNKFVTTYFRRSFVVPWNTVVTNLNFRLARSDGAAVWLNGQEMFRVNLPVGPVAYTNLALTAMTGYTAHIFYPTNLAVTNSLTGTNVLAVEVHQSSVTNSTMGFDMELIGSGYLRSPPALSIAQSGSDVVLNWPVSNSAGFTLYSTTNPAGGIWGLATGLLQTNGGQIVVTQSVDVNARYYRLQGP